MPLPYIASLIAAVLFAGVLLFQAALAAGAPWGAAAYGGQNPGVLPARLRGSSVVSMLVLAAAALIVLARGGWPVWSPVPASAQPVVLWVLVGLLALGTLLNGITRSRIERAIWLPVTAVALLATLTVALTA